MKVDPIRYLKSILEILLASAEAIVLWLREEKPMKNKQNEYNIYIVPYR